MRKVLNNVYFGAALLGALFIVIIGLLICAQVLGRQLGVQVKGADEITAWSVVAAGFLPLAYTFRNGRHIRVTLLIERTGRFRMPAEFVVLCIGLYLTGYLAYSSVDMVWDSIRFEDQTQGLINLPLWIPQISIPIGSTVLAIAILDDLVTLLRGTLPSYVTSSRQKDRLDSHTD
ncbi:MAG: TRAP transporter small permease [Aestuariivita sp.]|nr:TRAP transporter small permease [Aestuariivita sp.]MCY4203751.1 TRAP transporter small permease [Aestuariivita sp.]MCY4287060.1 TRAP transporter small permease [Aestuariivita sp.]MCY4345481.1 TRAP transporter small permease [Aestuariivita sp.]